MKPLMPLSSIYRYTRFQSRSSRQCPIFSNITEAKQALRRRAISLALALAVPLCTAQAFFGVHYLFIAVCLAVYGRRFHEFDADVFATPSEVSYALKVVSLPFTFLTLLNFRIL